VPSFTTLTTRFLIVLTGAALGLTLLPAAASASPSSKTAGNPTAACDGTHHSDTGHGANHRGAYDETCDGSPSGNGNGGGQATGKPCAGCVGNADDKNPKGQAPNGSDHNAGYECDRNHGVGRTNPAHTGCTAAATDSTSTGGKGGRGTSIPKEPKGPRGAGHVNVDAAADTDGPGNSHCPVVPGAGIGDEMAAGCRSDATPPLEPGDLEAAPTAVADPTSGATVLGVSFVRPASGPAAASVLGAETARSAEGELPLTGGRPLDPAAFALVLVALGALFRRVGRRPAGDRVW
jgi:hypothetical protein